VTDHNASNHWQRPLIAFASLILGIAALYLARSIIIPVVLAVLLTFILSPLVIALQRRGLGRFFSMLVVVVLTFSLLAGLIFAFLFELRGLGADLPKHKKEIIAKIEQLQEAGNASWLDDVTATVNDIHDRLYGASDQNAVPVKLETSHLPILQSVAGSALELLVTAGFIIVLVAFMLVQREDLRKRVIRLWAKGSLTSMTKAIDDATQRISRFLLLQLLVNIGFGICIGIGLVFLGVPYTLLWGFMGALLRYIPYIGSWLAALLAVLFSLGVLPGWTQPILVLILYTVLELTFSNVIEPALYGHTIGVSEVALLIGAAFWTWLWGPIGLVLSTPMMACLVVIGRYVPEMEFFRILLGSEPPLETHVTFYQRLLARDQVEATDLIEDYLKDHSVADVCEQVFLPALLLAKDNRERGNFTSEDEQFVLQATREILDEVVIPNQEVSRLASARELPTDPDKRDRQKVLVLGCPGHDDFDELALSIFQVLFDPAKTRFEVDSAEMLSSEVIHQIEHEHPVLVCIATLPPQRPGPHPLPVQALADPVLGFEDCHGLLGVRAECGKDP
jgi:predicted PurR-regulated permease PerM